MTKQKKSSKKPIRSQQVPATSAMLYEMEGRINHNMKAGFHSLRSEMSDMKTQLRSEMGGMKSDIHSMKSDVHGIKSELHRVALLVEEQNARNKYVMDGYSQIYDLLVKRV